MLGISGSAVTYPPTEGAVSSASSLGSDSGYVPEASACVRRLPHHIGPSWLRAGCSYGGLWRFLRPPRSVGLPTAVDVRSVVPAFNSPQHDGQMTPLK